MMVSDDFLSWPKVLNETEAPFVLGFAADPRPAAEFQGIYFRRGAHRYKVDLPLSDIWLRAFGVLADDGNCYMLASIGPIFNEWWPMLERAGADPSRPCLSAGATRSPLTMLKDGWDTSLPVTIAGPSEWLPGVSAMVGLGTGLSDETLLVGDFAMLGVIKAALLTLCEYRTLVHEVPLANIAIDAGPIELATLLEIAQEAAQMIDWKVAD